MQTAHLDREEPRVKRRERLSKPLARPNRSVPDDVDRARPVFDPARDRVEAVVPADARVVREDGGEERGERRERGGGDGGAETFELRLRDEGGRPYEAL